VLSGASTVEQLHSNLAALDIAWDESLERELASMTESADQYWDTRSGLPWT
jgi:aryl-alcohol dehydrogenase-like predicted oxidoreductase